MIYINAFYFLKFFFKYFCEPFLRILFDNYATAFFWTIFRKGSNNCDSIVFKGWANFMRIFYNFSIIRKKVKRRSVMPKIEFFGWRKISHVGNHPLYHLSFIPHSLLARSKAASEIS